MRRWIAEKGICSWVLDNSQEFDTMIYEVNSPHPDYS